MNQEAELISISGGNVSEQTYGRLLSMIESGDLTPGQVLEERGLAVRLSVSRTPMRMALSRLLGEGVIKRLSNGSMIIREVGLEEYLELVQFRKMAEGEAAYLAADRISQAHVAELMVQITEMVGMDAPDLAVHWSIDDRLHTLIAQACGNRWLAQAIAQSRRMVRMCNVEKLPRRFHETCHEHLAILQALKDGNGDAARENMRAHIDQVRKVFISLLNLE